ncbi:hypothetical protein L0128_11690 [candidate division KSB1 bacterium]|nr:hypothetical protein [candidate division KSB1 bacterium]
MKINTQSVNPGRSLWLLSLLLLLPLSRPRASNPAEPKTVWPIITRQGDQLLEGNVPFRFLGLAAPNLQQNESQLCPDQSNRFPDEYEIRDLLGTLNRLGARATRTFSLSVYSPADQGLPVYISARRTYNETAFRCLDLVIAFGHEYDVRLIIPLIASQSFYGIRGVDEFAALAGKPPGSFWTDPEVKADFRHFLDFILNRRNTVNGLLYKDDPAILAWQLGNEFGSYAGDRGLDDAAWRPRILAWSLEMAAYMKSVDPRHLIMEAGGVDRAALINDPNIDIISEHLYEYWNRLGGRPWELAPLARIARQDCQGKKPLIVDEFGLGSTENLYALMQTIRETGIVGGLMWSLRSHRRDGGWYYHNEGGTPVNSFHYPGFAAGFGYEETRLLDRLRAEAYLIRGLPCPAELVPAPAPVLRRKGAGFTWRGATGAAFYTIERADFPAGEWQLLGTGLHDSIIQDVKNFEHTPQATEALILFYDESKIPGKTYYYRIKGANRAGESEYSNILELSW